jgi:DNA-binding Lrp family transcriptional regulator
MNTNTSHHIEAPTSRPASAAWWHSVCALRRDGRQSLTALSRETGVAVSTLHDRLRTWSGLRRATVLLDFAQLGGVHTWIVISAVPARHLGGVEAYLMRHPAVNTVQRVLSDADFLVEIFVPDLRAVEDFVNALHMQWSVGASRLLYVVRDAAREAYLTEPLRYPALTGAPALETVPNMAADGGEVSALEEMRMRVA